MKLFHWLGVGIRYFTWAVLTQFGFTSTETPERDWQYIKTDK
jgi:hypothetical protein